MNAFFQYSVSNLTELTAMHSRIAFPMKDAFNADLKI